MLDSLASGRDGQSYKNSCMWSTVNAPIFTHFFRRSSEIYVPVPDFFDGIVFISSRTCISFSAGLLTMLGRPNLLACGKPPLSLANTFMELTLVRMLPRSGVLAPYGLEYLSALRLDYDSRLWTAELFLRAIEFLPLPRPNLDLYYSR